MKRIITSLAIATISCMSLWAADMQTYRTNVGDFYELIVADGINVRYVANPDSAGVVEFTTTPEVSSCILFVPNNFKLKVQISDEAKADMKFPTVTVYSTNLENVANWSDSTVTIERIAPSSIFKCKVIGGGRIKVNDLRVTQFEAAIQTGNGTIFATGQAKSAKYSNIGSGAIEASQLKADKVRCKVAGVGSIDCWATGELSVLGMGTGNVYYVGEPTIKKTAIGVKVISMNEDDPSKPQALE